MYKSLAALVLLSCSLPAQIKDDPQHLFRAEGPLTDPSGAPAREIALRFAATQAAEFSLSESDLKTLFVSREYRSEHNGVTHITLGQEFDGVVVTGASYVVNVSAQGEVINAGGRLFPRPQELAFPEAVTAVASVANAVSAVNLKLAEGYTPAQTIPFGNSKSFRFARGRFADEIQGTATWFATSAGVFPAWTFTVADPESRRTWAVTVEAHTGKILAKNPLTLFQSATPRGLVFERGSPQPAPVPGTLPAQMPPVVQRTLQPFTGSPAASPRGWVTNNQTAGNNAVAGANPLGLECVAGVQACQTRPIPVTAPNGDFSFPLELGPGAPNPTNFAPAVTTNLFYWLNRAHDFFYAIGFNEAAGNFQEDNFGKGGQGGDAVYGYAQAAIAAPEEAVIDNADFGGIRISEDGSRPRMAMYLWTLGGMWLDGSLDASVVVHEYTHGVTNRLALGLYGNRQGRAMGEAWSDFFAVEMLEPEGAPVDGAFAPAAYALQSFTGGLRSRPYSTNFDINPLTFAHYGRIIGAPEEHADGEIWAQAVLEVRAELIKQFGEREGRSRARQIMIDSLKLAVPSPSMIDARDAVLLADRTTFNGASQERIWAAFARRGFGVLAQSYNANSVHISPNFDVPSKTASLRFYNDTYVIGEAIRVVLQDSNQTADRVHIQLTSSSGDLENVQLRRRGSVFYGIVGTRYAPAVRGDGGMNVAPADAITAYYTDHDTGAAPRQVTFTAPTYPDYDFQVNSPSFSFSGERPIGLRTGFGSVRVVLPFDFPYFGKTYKSAYLYNNGVITFDRPDYSPCSDVNSLALIKAIAPLWMPLRTNGRAQPNEDVYLSQNDTSITFRWAAETARDVEIPGLTASADPVNFAARLHQDGRIEFFYGSGNKNLTGGSQLFGCPTGAPTVGISSGQESFVQLAITHDGQGNLENALKVIFEPGFSYLGGPTVVLESPKAGDVVTGVIKGSGVVYDTQDDVTIRRIDVILDGIARTTAQLFVTRRDFCSERQVSGCPRVGFTFALDPAQFGLAPGTHRLLLRATNTRGVTLEYPETPLEFQVEQGKPEVFGRIESPEEGAEASARLSVSGYIAVSDARVASVEILVDGINYGLAGYGITKTAACAELPANTPGCPRIGFIFSLQTNAQNPGSLLLPNGPHTLQIRARDEFGRYHLYPETPLRFVVNNEANQPPRGVLTSPLPNARVSGILNVTGYAWDPDGKVNTVTMFIDDAQYVTTARIVYGGNREEVCATLPDAAACPAIGFDGEFDTRRLSNGLHSFRVRITDDKGRSVDVPAVLTGGLNFYVDNP